MATRRFRRNTRVRTRALRPPRLVIGALVALAPLATPSPAAATNTSGPSAGAAPVAKTGKSTKDTTPPTVVIDSPANGATVTPSVTVTGTAFDNVSVASVQVSLDGATFQTASGTTSWTDGLSSLSGGSHTITAKATDTSGNTANTSVSVTVNISVALPTSTILWPRYPNAVVAGAYTLEGASSDDITGVAREQWAVDGTVVATGTSSYGLSYSWDTSTVAQGVHTVTYTTWNATGASSSASQSITVSTHTIKRVAVILYNFENQAPPTTPQRVSNWTFGTSRSVAGFYQENSYGKMLLGGQYNTSGDVLGFYTIPYAEPTSATCDFGDWDAAALEQATAAGVDLNGYDVYLLTAAVPTGCGSGTGGGVEDIVPWNNPQTADQWIAFAGHELGHSFGIHHHADSWTCVDSNGHPVQVGGTCTSTEYGDPYDIMAAGQVEHMNAYEKGQLGFFGSGNASTVTTSGTYTLAPVTAPSPGVQSIRVPRAWDAKGNAVDFYYLEYRQPAAYDVPPSHAQDYDGILIREAPDYSQTTMQSNLIDTTPGSLTYPGVHDNFDAPLKPGMYFQDLSAGISVKTVSVSSSGATIQVSFGTPTCVRLAPTVSMSTTTLSGPPGATLDYPFAVTNNDSPACGPSDISVLSSVPLGFTQDPASTVLSGLYPSGATSSWMLYLTSPPTASIGSYTFGETASNASRGMSATIPAVLGVT